MKDIKGVILAGGTGSRLYPLTKVTNKHLLPVGKYPMIFYPIYKLVEIDIKEILIVTGTEHMGDIVQLLGSGSDFNCNFTYKVQDTPGGIAHALLLAEEFAKESRIIVILGDNIFKDSLKEYVNNYKKQKKGARIILKEVENPTRFGVVELEKDKLVKIIEKPTHPPTNYCVTGVYMYDNYVFDIIKRLKPSARGELEITDVNNEYIKLGLMEYDFFKGWWSDAGTFQTLLKANTLVTQDQIIKENIFTENINKTKKAPYSP